MPARPREAAAIRRLGEGIVEGEELAAFRAAQRRVLRIDAAGQQGEVAVAGDEEGGFRAI